MEARNARARLIAAEAHRVATVLDGLPEPQHPRHVRTRLYALQAGAEVEVPGWLVGVALGVPLDQRSGSYVLTTADDLIPTRVHVANARAAA